MLEAYLRHQFHSFIVTFKPPCVQRHRPKIKTARFSGPASSRPFSLIGEFGGEVCLINGKNLGVKTHSTTQTLHHPFKQVFWARNFVMCSCATRCRRWGLQYFHKTMACVCTHCTCTYSVTHAVDTHGSTQHTPYRVHLHYHKIWCRREQISTQEKF